MGPRLSGQRRGQMAASEQSTAGLSKSLRTRPNAVRTAMLVWRPASSNVGPAAESLDTFESAPVTAKSRLRCGRLPLKPFITGWGLAGPELPAHAPPKAFGLLPAAEMPDMATAHVAVRPDGKNASQVRLPASRAWRRCRCDVVRAEGAACNPTGILYGARWFHDLGRRSMPAAAHCPTPPWEGSSQHPPQTCQQMAERVASHVRWSSFAVAPPTKATPPTPPLSSNTGGCTPHSRAEPRAHRRRTRRALYLACRLGLGSDGCHAGNRGVPGARATCARPRRPRPPARPPPPPCAYICAT